jgi:hypothetical protein
MVRLANSIFAVALLAVPTLAAYSEQFERSVAESDLYGRDFADVDDILVTREDLEELFGRELINDIEERDPFGLFSIFKGIKAAVKIGEDAHKAHEVKENLQGNNNKHHRREFDEDLEAREPLNFGAAVKGLRAAAKFAKKHHAAKHIANNVGDFNQQQQQNGQQNQRRDLEAREPLNFGVAVKGLRAAAKFAKKHHAAHHIANNVDNFNQQQNDQQYQREFEDEMAERDFDDEDFFEREFYDDLD